MQRRVSTWQEKEGVSCNDHIRKRVITKVNNHFTDTLLYQFFCCHPKNNPYNYIYTVISDYVKLKKQVTAAVVCSCGSSFGSGQHNTVLQV
jgi:hypothetical protein